MTNFHYNTKAFIRHWTDENNECNMFSLSTNGFSKEYPVNLFSLNNFWSDEDESIFGKIIENPLTNFRDRVLQRRNILDISDPESIAIHLYVMGFQILRYSIASGKKDTNIHEILLDEKLCRELINEDRKNFCTTIRGTSLPLCMTEKGFTYNPIVDTWVYPIHPFCCLIRFRKEDGIYYIDKELDDLALYKMSFGVPEDDIIIAPGLEIGIDNINSIRASNQSFIIYHNEIIKLIGKAGTKIIDNNRKK